MESHTNDCIIYRNMVDAAQQIFAACACFIHFASLLDGNLHPQCVCGEKIQSLLLSRPVSWYAAVVVELAYRTDLVQIGAWPRWCECGSADSSLYMQRDGRCLARVSPAGHTATFFPGPLGHLRQVRLPLSDRNEGPKGGPQQVIEYVRDIKFLIA
jgi:hypothetical protein